MLNLLRIDSHFISLKNDVEKTLLEIKQIQRDIKNSKRQIERDKKELVAEQNSLIKLAQININKENSAKQEITSLAEKQKTLKQEMEYDINQKFINLSKNLSLDELLNAIEYNIQQNEVEIKKPLILGHISYAIMELAKKHNIETELTRIFTTSPDIQRINQIETILNKFSEKIAAVRLDNSLSEDEKEEKIDSWRRIRDSEVAIITGDE